MKAVAVTPGKADTGRVQEVPTPQPGPGEVLVQVQEVGVCGTDLEILQGLYGEAPPGDDYLILGHENFGRVASAPTGSATVAEGDHVICMVRRPCPAPCPQCAAGENDMCSSGGYTERGIKGLHGFMSEYYVDRPEYLVKVPDDLVEIGVLMEPLSVVEKAILEAEQIQKRMTWTPKEAVVTGAGPIGLMATLLLRSKGYDVYTVDIVDADSLRAQIVKACGAEYVNGKDESLNALAERLGHGLDLIVEATAVPGLVFDAIDAVGPNGVVALTGVGAHGRTLEVPADKLNLEMVLDNKLVFGSVNANLKHMNAAAADLATFNELWPGLCERVVTRRVPVDDFATALTPRQGIDVKSTVSFR